MGFRRILLVFLFVSCALVSYSQRVGLVLSGGGARGVAHIGLIQALEDNGIPIDYIAGTSMGAVVGSLYAMGYTTEDMLKLIESEDFKLWQAGKFNNELVNTYKLEDPTPSFFTVKTSFKKAKPTIGFLPTSLIDPRPMNMAFLRLYSHATVRCDGDFDNLFVPFRAVASDVYNKEAVVLREGSLGDAVRASMTFPFYFNPIEINGVLVYDGGIYNNFPVDVMQKDFDPDFIIGSVVSDNPSKPEEGDLMTQIYNMVMQKTKYEIDSIDGVMIKFDVDNVALMDMHKAREIYELGYNEGMEYIEQIKSRVKRRVDEEIVEIKRIQYLSQDPVIEFDSVQIEGVNDMQRAYLRSQFSIKDGKRLTMKNTEEVYTDLLSGTHLSEIMPSVIEKDSGGYDLKLKVKLNQDLQTSVGGLVSSTNDNRIYLGARYQFLTSMAVDLALDAQIGKSYGAVSGRARMSLPTFYPMYLEGNASFISRRYYEKENLFLSSDEPFFVKQKEGFFKVDLGMPLGIIGKMVYGVGIGKLGDSYYQNQSENFSEFTPDRSTYKLFAVHADYRINRIIEKDFPTVGYRHNLKFSFLAGNDHYVPSSQRGEPEGISSESNRSWFQAYYKTEYYVPLRWKLILGISGDLNISVNKKFSNYTATIVQAAAYTPTQLSKTMFNRAYRSNNFAAIGLMPIWKFNNMFQLRTGVYAFQDLRKMEAGRDNSIIYEPFKFKPSYMTEIAGVCKLPFTNISVFVNHHNRPRGNWTMGLNIGYLIDAQRFYQ